MHEKEKLNEAKYFYSRMVEEKNNVENFRHNLSAFLSASRSVLQYSLKEAENKNGGKKWYNNYISKSPVLSFFKNKRDINIHDEPIRPRTDCTIKIGEVLNVSDSISVKLINKDGKVVDKYESSKRSESDTEKPKTTVSSEYRHSFIDWNSQEDIFVLCQMYIDEIECLIKDGIAKNILGNDLKSASP